MREAQQRLNELGYADKYGEPLKEDGILGAKTLYAYDTYSAGNNYEPVAASENNSQRYINAITLPSRGYTIRSMNTSTPNGVDYQIDYAMYYPKMVTPKMQTNEELAQKNNYCNVQSVNNQRYYISNYNQEKTYETKIKENATLNNKSERKIRKASNIISRNSKAIKEAGKKYGVNPSIIAACIYSEQILNVNISDVFKDQMYWTNPSVGIGQVAIETAKTIENYGKIEPITYAGKREEWHANGCVLKDAWNVPGFPTPIIGTKEYAIYHRLNNEHQCIEYVAAYLQLIQDLWKEKYPTIDEKSDILATLYNIGEYGGKKGINSNPEPNHFGKVAKQNYYHMQYLLGIE